MRAFGEALAIQAGSEIASGLSEQLSFGIGEITGYNDVLKKDALLAIVTGKQIGRAHV